MLAKLGGEDDAESGPKPSVPYWHLWTDADGISHQAQCALTAFELKDVGDADPQWNNKHETRLSTVVITVQPVGWVGDWHENPAPQWIVVLSGRWWIESMDGTRIEQGPGEFSLGEDQGCTPTDGKKGHRSGTIADQPAVLMTVQLQPTCCWRSTSQTERLQIARKKALLFEKRSKNFYFFSPLNPAAS